MIRRMPVLIVAMLLAVGLAACAPTPLPTPTPTGFATEKEAFAAAEETYRAYVDALNARREGQLSQPSPEAFLVGEALKFEYESQDELSRAGLVIAGTTRIQRIERFDSPKSLESAQLIVCLDSSETRVFDNTGQDVTPAERPTITTLLVSVTRVGETMAVEKSETTGVNECSA